MWKLGLRTGHSQEVDWKAPGSSCPEVDGGGGGGASGLGFTVWTVLLPHNLPVPSEFPGGAAHLNRSPTPVLLYPLKYTGFLLGLFTLPQKDGCSSVGNCTFPSFCFLCIIWVIVTTSQPFLPGEWSRVCKKLSSQAKRGHIFIYQNIHDFRPHESLGEKKAVKRVSLFCLQMFLKITFKKTFRET